MIPIALALPMAAAALIGCAMTWYNVRKRSIRHGTLMCLFAALVLVWLVFYFLELLLQGGDAKRMMLNYQYFSIPYLAPVFLLFTLRFTGVSRKPGIVYAALFAVPALSGVACWSNPWHGLFYTSLNVSPSGMTSSMALQYNVLYYAMLAYSALVSLFCVLRLVFCYQRLNSMFRRQLAIMLALVLLPSVSLCAYVLLGMQFNFTPVALVVSVYLYLWLISGYDYCQALPPARYACIERSESAYFQLGADNLITDMNPAACALLKKRPHELFMHEFGALADGLGAKVELDGMQEISVASGASEMHYIVNSARMGSGALVEFTDIGELRRAGERANYFANYDPLTALPNKELFFKHLQRELDHVKRFDDELMLMIIDIDGFHDINELHGYQAGDRILIETARRLVEGLRKIDTVSRFENDEFHVLLPKLSDIDAPSLVERLLTSVSSPVSWGGHSIEFTLSVGIARAPVDSAAPDELLAMALTALRSRQPKTRSSYKLYARILEDGCSDDESARLALESGEAACEFPPVSTQDGCAKYVQARVSLDSKRHTESEMFPHNAFGALEPSIELKMLHLVCKEHSERFSKDGPGLIIELEHRHLLRTDFIVGFCSSLCQFGYDERRFTVLLQPWAFSSRGGQMDESLGLLKRSGAEFCLGGFNANLKVAQMTLDNGIIRARLSGDLADGTGSRAEMLMIEAAAKLACELGVELHAVCKGGEPRRQALFVAGVGLVGYSP